MSTTPCDDVRAQAADLALDILDGEERAALLGHLSSCPACRDEVRSLGTVADRLLRAVPADEPPPRLRGTGHGPPRRPASAARPPPEPAGARRAGAAAAIIVVALVGAALLRPGGDTREAVMVSTEAARWWAR